MEQVTTQAIDSNQSWVPSGREALGRSIFLTEQERLLIEEGQFKDPLRYLLEALYRRVDQRAKSAVLGAQDSDCEWWHFVAEYLSDAAMAQALRPSDLVAGWLRDAALSVARRPVADWVGPEFRDHSTSVPTANLETAHLSWSMAVVLDLASDIFTEAEQIEIAEAVREKGMKLCLRWFDGNPAMANWRCVLNAGVAVAACVLDDDCAISHACQEYQRGVSVFQSDGSYGESLQYGNYAGYMLMLTREALIRCCPELAERLPLAPWVGKPRWDAASLLYLKPMTGWGACKRPRSANFNDSAAIYRASADFLLHIARYGRDTHTEEAGLARWLFDTLYAPSMIQGPYDRATFGFVNDFGFLTFSLLPQAADALSPREVGMGTLESFSCGDVVARDRWEGKTVLATHGGGDLLYGAGHLHGDLNSFILVHNRERLLLDPGHSCYRNVIHDLETGTAMHNTCCFTVPERRKSFDGAASLTISRTLEQVHAVRRYMDLDTGRIDPPVDRGGRRLLAQQLGDITVIGSEVSAVYGEPLQEFTRWWVLCGSHVVFVVDRVRASEAIGVEWNWLLNNRDDELDLRLFQPDRLVARRGEAAMKLFHLGAGRMGGPRNAYVHDAYHPLPRQRGEGAPGSGLLMQWKSQQDQLNFTTMHVICLDTPGWIGGWHLEQQDGLHANVHAPEGKKSWNIDVTDDAQAMRIWDDGAGESVTCATSGGPTEWKLSWSKD